MIVSVHYHYGRVNVYQNVVKIEQKGEIMELFGEGMFSTKVDIRDIMYAEIVGDDE